MINYNFIDIINTAIIVSNLFKIRSEKYGKEVGDSVYVLYGGSVKPENVKDYVNDENIDGALVGGASLKAESFIQMIDNLID